MDFTDDISTVNVTGDSDPFARYVMPNISVTYISKKGGQTSLDNINEIAKKLNRTPRELVSYIQKQLATALTKKIILNGKFTAAQIQTHLTKYINDFVLCGTCQNPETDKEGDVLVCNACGNRTDIELA